MEKQEEMTDREKFLQDHGAKESDIFEDDKGEYILSEPCFMDDGDEIESGDFKKIYLE